MRNSNILSSHPIAHEQRQCGTSNVRVEGTTCTLSDILHHLIILNMYLRDRRYFMQNISAFVLGKKSFGGEIFRNRATWKAVEVGRQQ
jgi:hypothetical protein